MNPIGEPFDEPTYTVVSGRQITYRLLTPLERENRATLTTQFVPVIDTSSTYIVVVDTIDPRIVHTAIDFTFDPVTSATFINIPAVNARICYNGYVFSSLQNYQQFHANGQNRGGPLNLYDTRPEKYVVNLNDVEPPELRVLETFPFEASRLLGLHEMVYPAGIYPILQDEDGVNLLMAIPFTGIVSDDTNEFVSHGDQMFMHNRTWSITIPFHNRVYDSHQISQYDDSTEQYFRTNPVPVITASTPLNLDVTAQVQRVRVRSFLELFNDVLEAQVAAQAIQQQLAAQAQLVPIEPSHQQQPPSASAGFIPSDLDALFQGITDDQLLPPAPVPQLVSVAGPSSTAATKVQAKKPLRPKLIFKNPVTDNKALHEFKTPDINDTIRVVAGPTNYTLLDVKEKQEVIETFMPILDNTRDSQPVRGLVYVYNPKDPDPETSGPFLAVPVFTGEELALMVKPTAGKKAILVRYQGWAFWPADAYREHYRTNPTNGLKRPEEYVDYTNLEPEVQLRQLESPGTGGRVFQLVDAYSAPACLRPAMRCGFGNGSLYMVVPFSDVAIESDKFVRFRNEVYLSNKVYRVMCRYTGFAFDRNVLKRQDFAECYRLRPVPQSELGHNDLVKSRQLPPSPASKKRNRHLLSGVYPLGPEETIPAGWALNLVPNDSYRPVLDTDGQLYLVSLAPEAAVVRAKLVYVEAGQGVRARTCFCNEDKSILTLVPSDRRNIWVFKGLKDTVLYLINDQPSNLAMPSVQFNDEVLCEDIETDDEEQQTCTAMAARNNLTTMGKRNRQVSQGKSKSRGAQTLPASSSQAQLIGGPITGSMLSASLLSMPTMPVNPVQPDNGNQQQAPGAQPVVPAAPGGKGRGKGRAGLPYSCDEDIDQTIESVVAQTLPSGSQTGAALNPSSLPSSALSMPTFQPITGSMLSASLLSMPTLPVNPVQPVIEQQAPGAQPVVPAAPGSKRKSGKGGSTSASKK